MSGSFIAKGEEGGADPRRIFGDVMFALLKSFFHLEFLAECGRLLLLTISASYVGANVRRLAAKHGWDHHLLYLVYCIGTVRRRRARDEDHSSLRGIAKR
jgi:hypothetical protein